MTFYFDMQQKYLSHAVLHNGQVWRSHVVWIDAEGNVHLERFDGEIPGTIFISGIVCVCAANRVTDSHRKSLLRIVVNADLTEVAIRRTREYMLTNGLYLNSVPDSDAVLIPLKRK